MGLDTGCPLLSPFLAVISCNARGAWKKIFLLISDIFLLVFDKSNRGWDKEYQIDYTDLRPPALEQIPRQGARIST